MISEKKKERKKNEKKRGNGKYFPSRLKEERKKKEKSRLNWHLLTTRRVDAGGKGKLFTIANEPWRGEKGKSSFPSNLLEDKKRIHSHRKAL